MNEQERKDIAEQIITGCGADQVAWRAVSHIQISQSELGRTWFTIPGGEDYNAVQDFLFSHMDSANIGLFHFLDEKEGGTHDLLGPFTGAAFEEWFEMFEDTHDSKLQFFRYATLRLSLSRVLDHDIRDTQTLTPIALKFKLDELNPRDQLVLLVSLSNVIPDMIIPGYSGERLIDLANRRHQTAYERGEVGWFLEETKDDPSQSADIMKVLGTVQANVDRDRQKSTPVESKSTSSSRISAKSDYYTRAEAAERLRISLVTLDKMRAEGEIKWKQVGRSIRIPKSEVDN